MIRRLSRRSVFGALMPLPAATYGVSSRSGGSDDVHHEVQRVAALDACAGLALRSVAVLGRDRDHDLGSDVLTDERLVPARDDGADADLERRGALSIEVLVEGLGALVDL